MTQDAKSATLKMPGADIYHEVRGVGPTLLVIPGGPQDAGVFAGLAQLLAHRYTVTTYDPRGNSRSAFEGEPEELDVDVQADDAARLIEALGGGAAYVFGTSGGAQIGLNLAARHPERVNVLVAHEPPTIMLLPDPEPALAAEREIHDTYLREGVDAAMAKFFEMNALEDDAGSGEGGHDGPPQFDMSPEEAETFARVSGNFEYWLAHGMRPLGAYVPDLKALRAGRPRVVVAIGEQSAGLPIEAMGLALAAKLGSEPVIFPGDHMGFETHTEAFAESLHRVFGGR
jgi:pimeloyl-ACP methyl ester carboxylesterase